MRAITITVPGRPPGANELIRMGHWRIGKVRAAWKHTAWLASYAARSSGNPPWEPFDRAEVAIEWRCKTRRRRDYDNLVSGLKPILDGIVAGGILTDDSSDVIVRLGPLTIVTGAKDDQTVLTVTEVRG